MRAARDQAESEPAVAPDRPLARWVHFDDAAGTSPHLIGAHDLATIDSPASPVLTGTPYSAHSPASPSHIRELAVKPPHLQVALVGASLAATLALVVVVVRARSRRRARATDTGSGVFGTIVKGALFAAAQTVVKLGVTRLAAKALHHDNDPATLEAASP